MSLPWSRRSFLHLSGSAVLLGSVTSAGVLASAGGAGAADAYDTLRLKWHDTVLGTGFDPAAAPFTEKLALLGTQAVEARSTMAPVSGSLWPDLPLTVSSSITNSYGRLATMAQAYAQPGTGLTGSTALVDQIRTGLDHLYNQAYNPSKSQFGNWWDFQIGSPQILLDISAVLYDQLSATQVANHLAAVDKFVPDSSVTSYTGTSTGANRVDLCRSLALRGILGKNDAKIMLARNALSPSSPSSPAGTASTPTGPSSNTRTSPTPAPTARCSSADWPASSPSSAVRPGRSSTPTGRSSSTRWRSPSPRSSTTAS